jgi:lipid II:glycine glycyltransferase (peptidoglycan interpeptide bridge formation enzyme)
LQSAEWGQLKSAFGWNVVRIVIDNAGIQLLFRKLSFGFTIAYAPKPFLGDQSFGISERLWVEIDAVCKKNKAIFLKIEPDAWDTDPISLNSERWSLVKSPHNIQPPRTIVVSLEGSSDDILARMRQKCRYNVRLAEKKGVTVRAWDDLEAFYGLMQITGGRDGFGVHSLAYYRRVYELFHPVGLAEILVAEFEGKPLAALMVFASRPLLSQDLAANAAGGRSWYLYGASNDHERNRMPTYLLQWAAMQWAKARGCDEYDLWGIPDEDEETLEAQFENRQDGLWGVYRFKRGFGGQVKRAVQALDKIYIPLLYRLYLWRMGNKD